MQSYFVGLVWAAAHCRDLSSLRTGEVTPGMAGQSGCLLSPLLGPFPLAHPTTYCLFLMIPGSSRG